MSNVITARKRSLRRLFSQVFVCPLGGGRLCSHGVGGSLSRGGVSVQGRGLCVQGRGLCPGEGFLSRGGVSVQGRGLCPGRGSLSGGSLPGGDRKLFSFFTSLNLRVSPQLHNNHVQHNYHPRTKFAKVVFTGVCLSTGGVSVHMVWGVSVGGVSVQGRGLCPGEGSLCPGEGSLSRGGVSVQGRGFCPGERSLSREGVSVWGISVGGVSVQGDPGKVMCGRYASYWNAFLLVSPVHVGSTYFAASGDAHLSH